MKKLKRGKKSGLVYIDINDIRSWEPCYDPIKHLPEGWRGTAVDILNHSSIPFMDKLWVTLRTDICSERLMRLAAVWFYRDTLNWVENPDPRSIEAANVAERFANGQATQEELEVARSASWSAFRSARSAAWSTARSISSALSAESVVWSAGSAYWSAAWSGAKSAESAARSAYWSAAKSVTQSVSAMSSAELRYQNKLIEMIKIEGIEIRKKKLE